jgi:hypothetical protein
MKYTTIFTIAVLFMLAFGCNKEEAIKPSADFTTNLQNNTVKSGRSITVYLDNVRGEFLVYFRGATEATTYSPTDGSRQGTSFSPGLDSLVIASYNTPGQYIFTVVASSSGNWAKDYLQDVKSITITVEP